MFKAVLIKFVKDTYAGIEPAIVDASRDLLGSDQYEAITMALGGKLAKIMVKTVP